MQLIWDIKNDIILVSDNYEIPDEDREYISGKVNETADGWKVTLNGDDLTAPANIDYFVRLWNALYPNKELTTADVSVGRRMTAAKKIVPITNPFVKLDYDLDPRYAQYMNSEGHIHPDADPEMMKDRNILVGDLGERILRESKIPNFHITHDENHPVENHGYPIDALFYYDVGNGLEPFAAEIKAASSHNARPYRYTVTGSGAKSSKQAALDKLAHPTLWKDYAPATMGITLRYDDNKVDAYLLPHNIQSFSRSTKGAIPLVEDMPFDFNGFHPDPYHQSRAPEKRHHGIIVPTSYQPEPDLDEIFGPDPRGQ